MVWVFDGIIFTAVFYGLGVCLHKLLLPYSMVWVFVSMHFYCHILWSGCLFACIFTAVFYGLGAIIRISWGMVPHMASCVEYCCEGLASECILHSLVHQFVALGMCRAISLDLASA